MLAVQSADLRTTMCSHAAPQCTVPRSAAVYSTSPSIAWSKGGSIRRCGVSEMTCSVRRATSAMIHCEGPPSVVFCAYHIPPLIGNSGTKIKLCAANGAVLSTAYGSARMAESVSMCSKLIWPSASSRPATAYRDVHSCSRTQE